MHFNHFSRSIDNTTFSLSRRGKRKDMRVIMSCNVVKITEPKLSVQKKQKKSLP